MADYRYSRQRRGRFAAVTRQPEANRDDLARLEHYIAGIRLKPHSVVNLSQGSFAEHDILCAFPQHLLAQRG